jgi:hypothetical protein
MASVTVFVDRVARGDLPNICVRTGAPATGRFLLRKPIGDLGWAWVLLVLGPPGWLILAIVSASGAGRETLEVNLPYSEEAYERHRSSNRVNFVAWVAVVAAMSTALTGGLSPWLWAPVGGVAFAVAISTQLQLGFGAVGVRLDASRRWVTLNGVHDNFADALARESRADGASI